MALMEAVFPGIKTLSMLTFVLVTRKQNLSSPNFVLVKCNYKNYQFQLLGMFEFILWRGLRATINTLYYFKNLWWF